MSNIHEPTGSVVLVWFTSKWEGESDRELSRVCADQAAADRYLAFLTETYDGSFAADHETEEVKIYS